MRYHRLADARWRAGLALGALALAALAAGSPRVEAAPADRAADPPPLVAPGQEGPVSDLRPLAVAPRVMVVSSRLTERGRPGSIERAALAVAELRAAGVEPRVVGDAALSSPRTLKGADVLVLPYVACMTYPARRVVNDWVKAGGGLVGLFFTGRDDERCRPLVGQGVGRAFLGRSHYGGNTEWADLSPSFGAWFVNDVHQKTVTLAIATGGTVGARAAWYARGRLAKIRMTRPNGVWTELVRLRTAPPGEVLTYPLSQTAAPVLVYRSATQLAEPKAVPGAPVGWTTTHGAGRAMYIGFNVLDLWHPWASRFSDPESARSASALLRAGVDWASR